MVDRLLEVMDILHEFETAIHNIPISTKFSEAIDCFLNCKGKIVVSGIGKAGIAMRKFSATLSSLGFPSCFLHPTEAQHGDLGMLQPDDLLFICSTSGKTREVYELIDLARKLNVSKIIGLTSHADSPIRDKVDLVIDMGVIKEAGAFGIAPTSSIIVILAITDCLALIASKEKGFTREDYGLRHHRGYCGQLARGDDIIH